MGRERGALMAYATKEQEAAYRRQRRRSNPRERALNAARTRAEREAVTQLRQLHSDEWQNLYARARKRHGLPSEHHQPRSLVQLLAESTPSLEQMEGEIALMRLDSKPA